MELNHIFLFIAVITPLAILARAWQPGGAYRGWRLAAFVVLAITGVSWFFFRDVAGFIGGGAWFALLFLPTIGLRRMADLAMRQRYTSAARIARALLLVHPSAELRRQTELLKRLGAHEAAAGVGVQPGDFGQDRQRPLLRAPAVVVLICLNVAVFLIELLTGGGTNELTLHRLGALEPNAVIFGHEYWRLLTSLFLHYGAVHLLFNLFALYVLGPGLERAVGSARFVVAYLISGLGSTIGVVILAQIGLMRAQQLVGASGSIMGIVGAWAAFLLQHRHLPSANRRLQNVLMIVLIQIAFDLSTPQVSTAAHLCGLITGFLVGLVIARKQAAI